MRAVFVSRHSDRPRHVEEMAIASCLYGYRELAETDPRDDAGRLSVVGNTHPPIMLWVE